MNWEAALEVVTRMPAHQRFAWLCSEDNPDVRQRNAYRDLVIRIAREEIPHESDTDRAARLIAENPPTNPVPLGNPCGGC